MKREKREQLKKQGFIFFTTILVLITALSIAGTVQSKERDRFDLNNPLIKEEEKSCVEQVKKVLEEHKCKNSGVTITKTIDIQGMRQYQVTIHHDKINKMTDTEKRELCQDLEEIKFKQENFTISYNFITDQSVPGNN